MNIQNDWLADQSGNIRSTLVQMSTRKPRGPNAERRGNWVTPKRSEGSSDNETRKPFIHGRSVIVLPKN